MIPFARGITRALTPRVHISPASSFSAYARGASRLLTPNGRLSPALSISPMRGASFSLSSEAEVRLASPSSLRCGAPAHARNPITDCASHPQSSQARGAMVDLVPIHVVPPRPTFSQRRGAKQPLTPKVRVLLAAARSARPS